MKNYRVDNKNTFELDYDECVIDPLSQTNTISAFEDYNNIENSIHLVFIRILLFFLKCNIRSKYS